MKALVGPVGLPESIIAVCLASFVAAAIRTSVACALANQYEVGSLRNPTHSACQYSAEACKKRDACPAMPVADIPWTWSPHSDDDELGWYEGESTSAYPLAVRFHSVSSPSVVASIDCVQQRAPAGFAEFAESTWLLMTANDTTSSALNATLA